MFIKRRYKKFQKKVVSILALLLIIALILTALLPIFTNL